MRYALIILTLALSLLTSRAASAQFLANDDRPEFITLSTSTTSAVAVGVIMLTVVSVKKDPTAMNRYLRQNEPAVRAAMALGGGRAVEDLAAFFELGDTEIVRFAALLRRHRAVLTQAAYQKRNPEIFASLVETALLFERMR